MLEVTSPTIPSDVVSLFRWVPSNSNHVSLASLPN